MNITLTFAGVGPRFATGKHKGQCNFANNVKPLATYSSISGTGTVKFA